MKNSVVQKQKFPLQQGHPNFVTTKSKQAEGEGKKKATRKSEELGGLLDVSVRGAPWPGEGISEGVKGWSLWGKLKKPSGETCDKGKYLQPLCKGQIFLKCKLLLEFYEEKHKSPV